MIYSDPKQVIPQEHRKAVNEKILHVIETGDMQGLSNQDVYEAYSPMGALHGLEFKDFNSFYEFTEAKKAVTDGQYFTPPTTSKKLVDLLGISKNDLVCDMTCGHGAFFNFLPNQHNVYGCELDSKAFRVAKFLYPDTNIVCTDVRQYEPNIKFDFMVLNPPFNLRFGDVSSQHYTCKRASELLKPLGIIGLIVPKSFMADEMMNKQDISMMNENFSFVGQYELSSTEFKSMGVSNFETKMMFFQKISAHVLPVEYTNEFLSEGDIPVLLELARTLKKQFRVKSLGDVDGNEAFLYKVKKYLYEFKTHKNLEYYHTKAKELLNKYNTQTKPEKMEWKEWDRIKLTEARVLSTFKRVMKGAYKVEVDKIRLVKHSHSFSLKGYSAKTRHIIAKRTKESSVEIIDLITSNSDIRKVAKVLGCDTREYDKVVERKRLDYHLHNTPISELQIPKDIKSFTNRFKFNGDDGEKYKLHDIQKEDLNAVLTRNHTLLSWEQGVGKSVGLLCAVKYMTKNKTVRNVFITAPAIAMDLTLKGFLENNGIKFIEIKNSKDFKKVKDGQVLVMTLGRLSSNKKAVTEFVKSRSNKVGLIFDESDEITNYSSKRTRSVLSAFRRCKKTILMTGTVTRNNIAEFYSNYELLYNNSHNMMCNVKEIYAQDKKTKDIKKKENQKFGKPFGAYYGHGLFKSCFSPSKASVFGIQKDLQDIYNTEELRGIIKSTIITRTFEEVAGKKLTNHTVYVQPNLAESTLQQTIMNDFHELCYSYFQSTGNSRKESYLRIIRMINLLIKSTSAPHLMNEWTGQGLPTKYSKVIRMVCERDEQVLVGCVGIESTKSYFEEIKKACPDREVIYIDGSISFDRRKKLIAEYNKSTNSIIVANQASLKSSVNIPECNEVIITALPWNGSKLSQFTKRTVRFNSSSMTNVNLVCYADSIELNILNLILNKEKVNQFIKTTDVTTDDEVNEEYGVDGEMLGNLIQKHYDEEGGMRLSWGNESKRN